MRMRGGLGAILQTLTPEAASVLTLSVKEAARRKHGQTTPLHVAATLLAAPSGLLRRACVSSHPDSAHPLRCRALDLCFSVALDRLPSSSPGGGDGGEEAAAEPPMSNALKAAVKRAQAHQRRGCPEQPPTPLVAVKIELEQLVVSILDDPSVSRVMREARFSSVAVKATVERSISSSSASTGPSSTSLSPVSSALSPSSPGVAFGRNLSVRAAPAGKLYMNPRLHQHRLDCSVATGDDVQKVIDVMLKLKKRNPVLVGDCDSNAVMKRVLHKIESGDAPPLLHAAKIVSFFEDPDMATAVAAANDLSRIPTRVRELRSSIEAEISGGHGVVLDLGDLTWLVESPGGASTGTARLQPKQVSCEAGRALIEEMRKLLKTFDRSGHLWIVGTATCSTYLRCQVYHPTMENDWDVQAVHVTPRLPIFPRIGISSNNMRSSGEAGTLARGFGPIAATATTEVENTSLPRWLQLAKLSNGSSTNSFQAKQAESKIPPSQNLFSHQWNQEKTNLHRSCNLHSSFEQPKSSSPQAPAMTDLVLWNSGEGIKANEQRIKLAGISDVDAFKRLLRGLADKVSWQQEASSTIAAVVTQRQRENRKRPSGCSKGDTWLLLMGPDKVGKMKMAAALSEMLFRTGPTTVSFADASRSTAGDGESIVTSRGRTSMDRVAEAVSRNPSSVVVLEDIDRADEVVQGSIKRAIERGRLLDSCGREVSLGSVIFVLTSSWSPELKSSSRDPLAECEENILRSASRGWRLELSAERKRPADWLCDGGRLNKLRKPPSCNAGILLDLNLAVETEDETGEGSSDLTTEHEHDKGRRLAMTVRCWTPCSASELIDLVDGAIMFKPVDFSPLRRKVQDTITCKFASIMGTRCSIKVDEEVVGKIAGGLWLTGAAVSEWAESVLVPNLKRLKHKTGDDDSVEIVRLSAAEGVGGREDGSGDCQWLLEKMAIAVEGL